MSLPESPEVSIITANYNCERFIESTIKSVIEQSYSDWEMLIVDDASTDRSVKIIEKYLDLDNRIQLIRLTKNHGPATARNIAIKGSKGRFIAFLDSDDLWDPEKLKLQTSFMKSNSYVLSYTEYKKINEHGDIISGTIQRPKSVNYKKMLRSNFIPCLTAMYDSNQIGKVLMPDILKRQDYALWLNILKKIDQAHCIGKSLAYYRVRDGDSVSSNKIVSAHYHWKILREVEKVNIVKSIYYFISYAIHGFLKFRK